MNANVLLQWPNLAGKRVVLGLSGGVACYKAAHLCRLLTQAGVGVQVVMSEAATQFITSTTLQALSGKTVFVSQWDARSSADLNNAMVHINLTREADAVIIAPTSANLLAKLATGRGDDLLSLLCLARPMNQVPLLLAPAMNREMWQHPATQRNVQMVQDDGATVLPVAQGEQACGEIGEGRMLEPEAIMAHLATALTPAILKGKRVLITAGPTFEALDPVRGITNRSSGKMGYALAQAAWQAGAQVTLVSGPVALNVPVGVTRIAVESAQQMLNAVMEHIHNQSLFIACAAVADWRAAHIATHKIKKATTQEQPKLALVENPDILAHVAQLPAAQLRRLFCVGFAAESENLLAHATAKRIRKGVPLLIGNLGPATFGQDHNELVLIDEQGHTTLPMGSKMVLAQGVIQHLAQCLASWNI